jgi:hypothetical protein
MDSNKTQILEPLSSMIELSLLSFSKKKPKLSIKHHGIVIDNSGEGFIPRNISRFIYGDSKEDLTILHPMIINYINWFIIGNINNNNDIYLMYKNIAICSVNGLKKLQSTYKIGNVVFSLQYYINLILKTLVDVDKIRDNKKNKNEHNIDSEYSDDFINYDDNNDNNDNYNNNDIKDIKDIKDNKDCKDDSIDNDKDIIKNVNNTYFKNYGIINDNNSLLKWTIPINDEVSLVDIEKIKTIWNMNELKNVYDMLLGCFNMDIDYNFIPKSDSVVDAKVKALKEVLYNKDNEFNIIIKKSYGT